MKEGGKEPIVRLGKEKCINIDHLDPGPWAGLPAAGVLCLPPPRPPFAFATQPAAHEKKKIDGLVQAQPSLDLCTRLSYYQPHTTLPYFLPSSPLDPD